MNTNKQSGQDVMHITPYIAGNRDYCHTPSLCGNTQGSTIDWFWCRCTCPVCRSIALAHPERLYIDPGHPTLTSEDVQAAFNQFDLILARAEADKYRKG